MNAIQNKVQLIGNLGKDPEVKNLAQVENYGRVLVWQLPKTIKMVKAKK